MHQNINRIILIFILLVGFLFVSGCKPSESSINNGVVEQGNTNGNIQEGGYFVIKDGWIYYSNPNDNDCLYKMKVDGSNKKKLNSVSSSQINVVNNWIYYTNYWFGGSICKIKTDGTSPKKILGFSQANNMIVQNDNIFYLEIEKNKTSNLYYSNLYKMNIDGRNKKKIREDVTYFGIDDKNIFTGGGRNLNLYKIDFDGKVEVKLNDDEVSSINIVDDYVYYTNAFDNFKIYKIDKNGKNRQPVTNDGYTNLNIYEGYIYARKNGLRTGIYKIGLDGNSSFEIVAKNVGYINVSGSNVFFYIIVDDIIKTGFYITDLNGDNLEEL